MSAPTEELVQLRKENDRLARDLVALRTTLNRQVEAIASAVHLLLRAAPTAAAETVAELPTDVGLPDPVKEKGNDD